MDDKETELTSFIDGTVLNHDKDMPFNDFRNLAFKLLEREQLASLEYFLDSAGLDNREKLTGEKEFLEKYLCLAMSGGRFERVITILKKVDNAQEAVFLSLWDEAHYLWMQDPYGTPLTPIQKFRIRKRFPPPEGICPGGVRPHRMVPEEKSALVCWMRAHRDKPYPTNTQKTQLSEETGLSVKQVAMWFGNERRRLKRLKKRRDKSEELAKLQYDNRVSESGFAVLETQSEITASYVNDLMAAERNITNLDSFEQGGMKLKNTPITTETYSYGYCQKHAMDWNNRVEPNAEHSLISEEMTGKYYPLTNAEIDSVQVLDALKDIGVRVSRETVSPIDAAVIMLRDLCDDRTESYEQFDYDKEDLQELDEVYMGVDTSSYISSTQNMGIDRSSNTSSTQIFGVDTSSYISSTQTLGVDTSSYIASAQTLGVDTSPYISSTPFVESILDSTKGVDDLYVDVEGTDVVQCAEVEIETSAATNGVEAALACENIWMSNNFYHSVETREPFHPGILDHEAFGDQTKILDLSMPGNQMVAREPVTSGSHVEMLTVNQTVAMESEAGGSQTEMDVEKSNPEHKAAESVYHGKDSRTEEPGYYDDDTKGMDQCESCNLQTTPGRDYGTVLGEAIQGLLNLSSPHGPDTHTDDVCSPHSVLIQYP